MHHRTKVMIVGLLSDLLTLCVAAGCASHATKTTQTVTAEESVPAAAPQAGSTTRVVLRA
jgi:hypothetical protein